MDIRVVTIKGVVPTMTPFFLFFFILYHSSPVLRGDGMMGGLFTSFILRNITISILTGDFNANVFK